MKKLIVIVTFLLVIPKWNNAQEFYETTSAGVNTVETLNMDFDPVSLGNILRNELIKLELFTVIDRYETRNALQDLGKDEFNCMGKTCLIQLGKELGVEKMFGGTVDQYGKHIIVSLRVMDVATGKVEKNHIEEFLRIQESLPDMVGLALAKMYNQSYNEELYRKLTNEGELDNTINNPDVQRLQLSGPRMGFGMILGDDATVFQGEKRDGGFEAWPVMSQFGYQFEYSYLNQGNVQALFEIIPMINGLEQGLIIPSLSILHGVRSNVNGLEFAFGPVISLNRRASGFFINDEWHLEEEKDRFASDQVYIEKRLDSRGDLFLNSGLVLAVGRTFRSGKVNFPVNLITVLRKNSFNVGVSFGFNASHS